MNFIKIVLVVIAAHLILLIGFYLGGIVDETQEGEVATAGANGIINWSNQDANATEPTVGASNPRIFDERAANLAGYNATDPQPQYLASNASSAASSQRYSPTRPDGDANDSVDYSSSNDDRVLQPSSKISSPNSPSNRAIPSTPLPEMIEYTVKKNDSLWSISKRFGVSVKAIEQSNQRIKANTLSIGTKLNIPRPQRNVGEAYSNSNSRQPVQVEGNVYVVKKGDSLSKIAAKQGSTVTAIRKANGINGSIIKIGQKLIIPERIRRSPLASQQHKGVTVVVRPGDSLAKIAARFKVSPLELARFNKIQNPSHINIGQTILIPNSGKPKKEEPAKQPARRAPKPSVVTQPEPVSTPPVQVPVEAVKTEKVTKLPVLESDDEFLFDEDLIEKPVVKIEE